jgi:hypothetical protein
MAGRSHRSKLVHRLVSPIATRIWRRIPRIRREFPRMSLHLSLARRPVSRLAGEAGRGRV